MTDALESYIMKSHKEAHPAEAEPKKDNGLKALMATNPTLPELYQQHCKQLKLKPDPSVMRMLEVGINDIQQLDFSTLVFSQMSFEAVMEVCRILPNLGCINLSNSNLKPECIQVLVNMAEEHKFLHSLILNGNNGLGFSAAKLLLPLIKDNRRFITLDVEGTGMAAPTKQLIKKVLISNRKYRQNMGENLEELENPTPIRSSSPKAMSPSSAGYDLELADMDESMNGSTSVAIHPAPGSPEPGLADSPEEQRIREENAEVKSLLINHEERLVAHYAELLATCERQQDEVREQITKGDTLMGEYKEHWKWPSGSEFSVAKCVTDVGLELPMVELESFAKVYTSSINPVIVTVKPLLMELLEAGCTRRRKINLIKDITDKTKGHGPGMAALVELVSSFCDLLNQDGNSMEAMKQMLSDTEEQINELKNKIDRSETSRQRSVQEEDLRAAETHFEASLELQEQLIDIILFRLNQLLDKASKSRLIENLEKLEEQSEDQIAESKAINRELKLKIADDIAKLAQKELDENAAWKSREQEFEDMLKRTTVDLADNAKKQDAVWKEMAESFKVLQKLSDERTKRLGEWMVKVEDHDRARIDYLQTVAVCQDHTQTLEYLKHDTDTCENLIVQFEEFIEIAIRQTKEVADKTSTEGDVLALDEQKRYLGLFRRFYMQLGELLFKKQKRLEEVDRMIRSCEFQIDFCKETLDPDLRRYRDQLKDLQIRRVEVSDRVSRLQIRGDDRASQFMPHEDALHKAGIEFDSPLLEMHEHVVDCRARVLEQRQKFIRRDKEELVDRETVSIDELVANTTAARNAGLSSMIMPLSNSGTPTPSRTPNRTPVPV